MIKTYHRPKTLEEALSLLTEPDAIPLGGGTLVNTPAFEDRTVAVVDLQDLGLDQIQSVGHTLEIGATVSLQRLLDESGLPPGLLQAIRLEAPLNLRNQATAAGTLVAADGRSTFTAALLALDAKVTVISDQSSVISLGDFLPLRPENLRGKLITKIELPANVKFAFEAVSRTPADKPIVCAALCQWPGGRTRLALGGWGKSPLLAMDGLDPTGLDSAARNAFHEAADDFASAAYRMDVAATLAKRCLAQITNE
ncbi:MAG: FAD binding domain-containing protein [Chloroflexota bacterium]